MLVPALCIFEVFRRVQQLRSRDAALEAVALMRQGKVIALDERLALAAAEISLQERLPTADSIRRQAQREVHGIAALNTADLRGSNTPTMVAGLHASGRRSDRGSKLSPARSRSPSPRRPLVPPTIPANLSAVMFRR